jgi:hypothetical protein
MNRSVNVPADVRVRLWGGAALVKFRECAEVEDTTERFDRTIRRKGEKSGGRGTRGGGSVP